MAERTCEIARCGRTDRITRGWCTKHYNRWYRYGSPEDSNPPSVEDRFWSKVVERDGCWEWSACRNPKGYGLFWGPENKNVGVHRYAYELLVGPIPDGLQLDHLCRNRACVNPAHLEPVTSHENQLRSPVANAGKKTCKYGHLLVQAKLQRRCLICKKRQDREWRERKKPARRR